MEQESDIIKDASYVVYDRGPSIDSDIQELPGFICGTYASFYNADGTFLKTVKHSGHSQRSRLDPCAPKPRPVSYRRIWWPGIDIGDGMVKGLPGYLVLIHDRNGHRIDCFRIEGIDQVITENKEYNLSNAFEEVADFSREPIHIDTPSTTSYGECNLW